MIINLLNIEKQIRQSPLRLGFGDNERLVLNLNGFVVARLSTRLFIANQFSNIKRIAARRHS